MDNPWHIYVMAMFCIIAIITYFKILDSYFDLIIIFQKSKKNINFSRAFLAALIGICAVIANFSYRLSLLLSFLISVNFTSKIFIQIYPMTRLDLLNRFLIGKSLNSFHAKSLNFNTKYLTKIV